MKRIRTILLASVAAGISTAAMAADIAPAVKNPIAVVTAPYSWTGFYAGVDLGYGWSSQGLSLIPTSPVSIDAGLGQGGVTLGGSAGYDYQLGKSFVVGAVADLSWSDINGSDAIISTSGFSINDKASLDWFGTIRGRAGYLITPNLLIYGTAGGAYGSASATGSVTIGSTSAGLTASGTNFGWTAGGGLEYAISDRWHAKAEWLHMDLGSISATTSCGRGCAVGFSHNVVDDVYRVGASYHF